MSTWINLMRTPKLILCCACEQNKRHYLSTENALKTLCARPSTPSRYADARSAVLGLLGGAQETAAGVEQRLRRRLGDLHAAVGSAPEGRRVQ